MNLRRILFLCLIFTRTLALAAPEKSVSISAYDTMKYSVTTIEAQPGQKITVTLTNESNIPKTAMAHGWVLLQAGTDPNAYAKAAINAKNEGYHPKALANKVIASIPNLGPKEHGSVTFTAPSVRGSYPFLCSFPAHCAAGMAGTLIVK